MRRRRATTLANLKDDARIALRDLARRGLDRAALEERVPLVAAKLVPDDEEALISLARHTPQLREGGDRDAAVRANAITALERVLRAELDAIVRGGPAYLEEQDRNRGCC